MEARLADLLAGLSRLADLGFGLQAGEALRSCALATRLARSLDLPEEDARAAFYTALLHHVGCTGYAHETARVFGDELVLNLAAGRTNPADPRDLFATFLPTLLRGRPPLERARLALATLARGNRFGTAYTTAACEVGRDAARRLGLPETVQRGVYHVYEEWRGGGDPAGLAGDDIPASSRLARLTGIAVLFDTVGGVELAADAVRRRGGGMLDPDMAARFAGQAEALLGEVNASDPRAMVLEGEPRPVVTVPDRELAGVAATFADLADLKSPSTHGHSRGVAALVRGAGERLRLPPGGVADLEVAGLLHDVGRVAVSDVVWEKPAPLSAHERERARLLASAREVEVLGLVAESCSMPRSPSAWSSPGGRPSTTCSTSTPRSACPAGPRRPCSRWSTTCFPGGMGSPTDARPSPPGQARATRRTEGDMAGITQTTARRVPARDGTEIGYSAGRGGGGEARDRRRGSRPDGSTSGRPTGPRSPCGSRAPGRRSCWSTAHSPTTPPSPRSWPSCATA